MAETKRLKIGMSKSPFERIHGQATSIPEPVWFIGIGEGRGKSEQGLRTLFAPWLIEGQEIYRPPIATIATLIDLLQWPEDMSEAERGMVAYWANPNRVGIHRWLEEKPDLEFLLGKIRDHLSYILNTSVAKQEGWPRDVPDYLRKKLNRWKERRANA
jgi:hypothetical protein